MPAIIEDGQGLTNANVYQDPADVALWLQERSKEAFVSLDDTRRLSVLIQATEAIESVLARSIGGVVRQLGQARLFPRRGCYIGSRCAALDEVPNALNEAIAYFAEALADPEIEVRPAGVTSYSGGGVSITWKDNAGGLAEFCPDAYLKVQVLLNRRTRR